MYPSLHQYCDSLVKSFDSISPERKSQLEKLSNYISNKKKSGKPVNIVYICTHNSRRSHLGQVWALAAANYYGVRDVYTYSGGTEVTALNENVVMALNKAGYAVDSDKEGTNPLYFIAFDDNALPSMCFSKKYDHVENPAKDFAAIMTCTEADSACPSIPNADFRLALPYQDPKLFDGTAEQNEKYEERSKQIGAEALYVFSKIK